MRAKVRDRVRLPRTIGDEDVGLGDVLKRATFAVGVRSCAAGNVALPRLTDSSFSLAGVCRDPSRFASSRTGGMACI
jgi:hypothetical protein